MPADHVALVPCRLARALTAVMLSLTVAIALLWSHAKLFSQDEMYEFQTDSVMSLRALVHVQRTWPISLDPILYHALSHLAMRVFGETALAQRLPSMAGFLLMQVCLFFLVRRLKGERAAAVAATFPAMTATLFYAVEGRPYGLLLGFYALALLCWVEAVQAQGRRSRALPLTGLALSLAAALNTHYFAVLLLFVIAAAELWRSLSRRQLDWPMIAALMAGAAGIVFTRPFVKAASAFGTNYYNAGSIGLHDITRAYRSLFVDYTTLPIAWQRVSAAALAVFGGALILGCWKQWQRRDPANSAAWVLLLLLAALPFGGYLLARFVTHSIEVRYVLGALVAISALLATAIARWLESDRVFSLVMAAMGIALLTAGAVRIRSQQADTKARLASLTLPEAAIRFLLGDPARRLYVQNMGTFEEDRFYIDDPQLQARMTLLYSAEEELKWNRHDTMALTAMHLRQFTSLPVEPYEQLRARKGEALFLLRHTGWDWTDQALAADHAQVRNIGHAMDGDLSLVRFR